MLEWLRNKTFLNIELIFLFDRILKLLTVTVVLINGCDLPAGDYYHGGARVQKECLYGKIGGHKFNEMNHFY